MSGGGGSTGEVSFPEHMEAVHQDWLGYDGGVTPIGTPDLIHNMDVALENNPLEELEFTDPTSDITEFEDEYDTWNTQVNALDESTDPGTALANFQSEVDSAGILNDTDIEAVVSDSKSSMSDLIDSIESNFGWQAYLEDLDPNADPAEVINGALDGLGLDALVEEVDVDSVIDAAQDSFSESIPTILENTLENIDQELIHEAVQQFAITRKKNRMQMRTQYKASMANIGAERSSAYALGLALLEIDFEREQGQYQTELSLDFYNKSYEASLTLLTEEISTRVRAGLLNAQLGDSVITQVIGAAVQYKINTNQGNFQRFATGYESYIRYLLGEVQAVSRGHILDKSNRDELLNRGFIKSLEYKEFIVQMTQQLSTVLAELKRVGYVMDQEYTSNTADLNWKHSSWDFEVYKNAINVLGGVGGSSFIPDGPSKAGSAIGGALQGAGTGAAVGSAIAPGPGTAIGAGIGAVIGAGSGLLS